MNSVTWIARRPSSHFIEMRYPKRRFSFRSRDVLLAVLVAMIAGVVGAQTITEFLIPTPESSPVGIAAAPDGALWFTESDVNANKIGRITASGAVTEFAIQTAGSQPSGIAAGPDGALWFTESLGNKVGRITTAGAITEFAIPTANSNPYGIAVGADGNLWFAEGDGNKIGRITVAGVIAQFDIPTAGSIPFGIAAGPDGNLWFTESYAGKIGRITTAGVITEFLTAGTGPHGIAAGPDGNLWFTVLNLGTNQIGKIERITTAGVITEFAIPTADSEPYGIAAGPDGNVWFAEYRGNKIGRITMSGAITEFAMPTGSQSPFGVTVGPDGNVWFTEFNQHVLTAFSYIGRITIARAPAVSSRALPVVGSTPGANGTFFKTSVQLHNPGIAPIAGQVVFHASGTSGSNSDPALLYSLAPGQTQSIPDLLPAMGRSGLGSADIEATSGSPPVATARVFNDAGTAGTTGFTEEAIRPEDALPAGSHGVLLFPSDLVAFRFNIGVRTLEAGASINLTLRDAAGAVVANLRRDFPAAYHLQQTATEFLSGSMPPPGGSVTVEILSGSAIVYGATVDNVTGDPSLQIAQAAP